MSLPYENLLGRYRDNVRPPHPQFVDRDQVPIRQIIIHHWVGWYGLPEGASRVQEIEAIDAVAADHLARFGIGPGYNYVVMPSGRAYYVGNFRTERRHTSNFNPATGHTWNWDSVAISAPGNWSVAHPRAPMLEAIHGLVDWIRDQPWSVDEPRIMGHRDSGFSTACPGDNLYHYLPLFRQPLPQENDDMTPDEVRTIARHLLAEELAQAGFGSGELDSALSALQDLNRRFRDHEQNHHQFATGPEHTHPTFGGDPDVNTGPAEG